MFRKKAEVSASLPGQIRRQIPSPGRYPDTIIKGYLFIEEGIQDRGIIGTFHAAAFHNKPDFSCAPVMSTSLPVILRKKIFFLLCFASRFYHSLIRQFFQQYSHSRLAQF